MPLINLSFEHVSINLIGPITPASDKGQCYILNFLDSGQPRGVLFKNIETKTAAEALLNLYNRVRIQKKVLSNLGTRHRRRRLERYPLQVRHKQDWGRGFVLLLTQAAALPGSDAGSGVVKPAPGFVIQNHQTSCCMWCPMYRARCLEHGLQFSQRRHTRNSVKKRDPICAWTNGIAQS